MLVDFCCQGVKRYDTDLEPYSLDLPMPPRKGEIVKLGPKGGMKYYQVVNSLYLENENIKAKEGGAICYVQEVSEEVAERQLGG